MINLKVASVVDTLKVVCLNPSIQSSVFVMSLFKNPVPATVNIMEFVVASKAPVMPVTVVEEAVKAKTQPFPAFI